MPRIPDEILDCSIHLYDSIKSAQDGQRSGGSGFLVHLPSNHPGLIHAYAVTNRHVVDGGFRVIRLNTQDGTSDAIQTDPNSWVFPNDIAVDMAVIPLDLDRDRFKWFSVGAEHFLTREIATKFYLGPGDETFLVGRLVTLEGRQRNTPVVRFGNVSMAADHIKDSEGRDCEAFLVECRSLSGFSGSPVFVVATREKIPLHSPTFLASGPFGPWLLGVDFGHMPLFKPVFEKDTRTETDYRVDTNTGIACVTPAWLLLALLNDGDLVKQRRKEDDEWARHKR